MEGGVLRSREAIPALDNPVGGSGGGAADRSPPAGLRPLRTSQIYSPEVMEDIQVKAELGRYRLRGFGTIRPRPLPSFDDLTFLPCSLTRIPLEGYRERCSTKTVLGTRFAKRPIELEIPVMITGMSWGALSYNAKVALAQGALVPAAEKFKPQLVMVSAGFDSRAGDPLGQFTLTDADFADLTNVAVEIARQHAGGKLVAVLEGGYSLDGLQRAVRAHLERLAS